MVSLVHWWLNINNPSEQLLYTFLNFKRANHHFDCRWPVLLGYSYNCPKFIWEHIWEKGPIGNWSHYVGFILELCSKYEIISWHVAKGYVLQCFWSSRDSSTLCFNILQYLVLLQPYVQNRPLCTIYAKICQYPKITLLLALIKRYLDKN